MDVRKKLSKERIAEVQDVFSYFDKDKDGSIMTSEVIRVARSCGLNPSQQEVKDLLEEFDPEGEAIIDFATFLQIFYRLSQTMDTPQEMVEAFRVFDSSGGGVLSVVTLREVLTSLGERLNEYEVDDLLAFADPQEKGEINYIDFVKIIFTEK